jgi:hypothetical protein
VLRDLFGSFEDAVTEVGAQRLLVSFQALFARVQEAQPFYLSLSIYHFLA